MFKTFAVLLCLCASSLYCQSNVGELRLTVTDPAGAGIKVAVGLTSEGAGYNEQLATSSTGMLTVQRLPYGIYRVVIQQTGFAQTIETVAIDTPFPVEKTIQLRLPTVNQSVMVNASNTLLDPNQTGSADEIGSAGIQDWLGSIPGRSLQDLVNSQPGWLYEGNAVLHPRGSEYQTQFVINGIPLTDNRSPSFGPEIEANDIQSMNIYTAGIPVEYGRKMGGVIEINTIQDPQFGLHGKAVFSGGSFDTATAFVQAQYAWDRNTIGGSASGGKTGWYLNPVVPQNYSNTGTIGDFSLDGQRDITRRDRAHFMIRHELARYDLPNEYLQQQAGQRQTGDNIETMEIASWQRVISPRALFDIRGMVRNNAHDFTSNPQSTPIQLFQHNWFREGYINSMVTLDRGAHQLKLGVESDNTFLNQNFSYHITNPASFDTQTPADFNFRGNRPDLEQAAFAEDLMRHNHWTLSTGLRWDHYQLLLNRQAIEPRISVARYFPSADLMLHFSYDRIFQTPSSANLLLSSSTAIDSLDPQAFLRLPVEPSRGNYYEAGVTHAFASKLRLDANYFLRSMNNFADDDQIDNTTISFPIAFRKALIYGAEGRIYAPEWDRFSGFLSYSYEVGNVWLPVTGGLFLGDNATAAETATSSHFPNTQDQRNTARGRLRYQWKPRLWLAGGFQFNSGLPFEFDGTQSTALAEYGSQVISRLNFARGRILPSWMLNASAGVDLVESKTLTMHLQADGENLNNTLNVIDFGGLFSGNAIGPPRSFSLRLSSVF